MRKAKAWSVPSSWCRYARGTSDHDVEIDAILALLGDAGPVEQYTDDGQQAMRLTPDGARVAQQMAMSDDPEAVLDALLDATEADT